MNLYLSEWIYMDLYICALSSYCMYPLRSHCSCSHARTVISFISPPSLPILLIHLYLFFSPFVSILFSFYLSVYSLYIFF